MLKQPFSPFQLTARLQSGGGQNFPLFPRWFAFGEWDDSIPTSEEWQDFSSWTFLGQWNDNVPTGTVSWTTPTGDGNVFTVWDDTVTT